MTLRIFLVCPWRILLKPLRGQPGLGLKDLPRFRLKALQDRENVVWFLGAITRFLRIVCLGSWKMFFCLSKFRFTSSNKRWYRSILFCLRLVLMNERLPRNMTLLPKKKPPSFQKGKFFSLLWRSWMMRNRIFLLRVCKSHKDTILYILFGSHPSPSRVNTV